MNNILFSGASREHMDEEVIKNINERLNISNSYVVVGNKSVPQIEKYELESRCMSVKDMVMCNYSKYDFFSDKEYLPLDDEVLDKMAPYLLEIIRTKQRKVKEPLYRLPDTLDYHYEMLVKEIAFWNNFLEWGKINYVVLANVPHQGYDNVIYWLCKIKGVKLVCLTVSLIPTLPRRVLVVDDYKKIEEKIYREFDKLKMIYKDTDICDIKLEKEIEQYFTEMSSMNFVEMKKSYAKGSSLAYKFGVIVGESSLIKNTIKRAKMGMNNYNGIILKSIMFLVYLPYSICVTLYHINKTLFIKKIWSTTKKIHKGYYKLSQMPCKEKYIYYAMHYVPEATSAPLGGGLYFDQKIPIRILAQAIPADWKLYVKIHPTQMSNMCSEETIKEISQINKVTLIREQCDSYELMQKSRAVATLTGSAAWEAQFLGIPSILFGYSEKNVAPLSYHVRTVEDCRRVIKSIQKNEKKTDVRELKIFIKASENISFVKNNKEALEKQLVYELERI